VAAPQPELDTLVGELEADLDEVVAVTITALREQVPGYGPDDGLSDADITQVLRTYLLQVLAALRGQAGPSFASTDEVMERRAESGISLPQMLHSYRVGILALWRALAARAGASPQAADALIAATPTIFEMLDRFSLRAHEIHTRLAVRTARRHEQIRIAWLDAVLEGVPAAGAPFWDAAAHLGIPREGTFVVIEFGPHGDDPPDLEGPLRARSSVRDVWVRVGPTTQLGLILLTGPRADLDALLKPIATPLGPRVGASAPLQSIEEIGRCVAQARIAHSATTAESPYVRYDHQPLSVLLASAPTAAASLIAQTLSPILGLPDQRRDALLEAVSTWLACGQSVNATATALHVHRNTVNYRLQRFQEIAGGSLANPVWVAQVLLALEARRQERI
jgi:hypothetical protein